MPQTSAISVRGLGARYGKRGVLTDINFDVRTGELFALVGANGAGKTTLFSILATLRSSSAGAVTVLTHDLASDRESIRRKIGIVFQEPAVELRLSGRENLNLMGRFFGIRGPVLVDRVNAILHRMGLSALADRPMQTLSGGERRKFELGRALIPEPRILFLDEATTGLDIEARRDFWHHIKRLVAAGVTVLYATHVMEEAELAYRVAIIDRGRILAIGTPSELKSRCAGEVLRIESPDCAMIEGWLRTVGIQCAINGNTITAMLTNAVETMRRLVRELPAQISGMAVTEISLADAILFIMSQAAQS